MATPEEIDSLEAGSTGWIGAANASTLLQLIGSRPRSSDPQENPARNLQLITQLHDAMIEHGDHELADGVLELARWPASHWVPTCTGAAAGS
jgi:hypothetical protein